MPTENEKQSLGGKSKRWLYGFINVLRGKTTEKDVDQLVEYADLADATADKADRNHTHSMGDISDGQQKLDEKASLTHTHHIEDVADLGDTLNAKAPLASPAFTGAPTVPTPGDGANNDQVATTAFVKNQNYAPIESPALSGIPTAPTPATANSSNQIATTAYVKSQKYVTNIDIDANLAGKSDLGHGHTQGEIGGLSTDLAKKANSADLKAMAKVDDAPTDGATYGRSKGRWVSVEQSAGSSSRMIGQATPYFGAVANKSAFEPDYLYADGRAVSRTAYPELFAVYGTIYGAGNGSTTFNIPDLRGVFVRGKDEGRGLDPSRNLATLQGDAMRNFPGISGSNAYNDLITPTGPFYHLGTTHVVAQSGNNYPHDIGFDPAQVVPTAHENRPVNLACHWFIVAQSQAIASSSDFSAAVRAVNASMGSVRDSLRTEMSPFMKDEILLVREEYPSGTNGGSFAAGAWRTRNLNTLSFNTMQDATFNPNSAVVTLQKGKYLVEGVAIAFCCGCNEASIHDSIRNSTLFSGINGWSHSTTPTTDRAMVRGLVDVASTANLSLQHRCTVTRNTDGLGRANSYGTPEVYAEMCIRRLK